MRKKRVEHPKLNIVEKFIGLGKEKIFKYGNKISKLQILS